MIQRLNEEIGSDSEVDLLHGQTGGCQPSTTPGPRQGGRLPLELVDQILRFASANTSILRACALTCHQWNVIARTYMFRRVDITNERRLHLLELVLQKAPHLDHYIRELSVGPFTPHGRSGGSTRWVQRVPENLTQLLTNVRTIRFIRLGDAGEFCDAEFFAMLYYFTSATQLILEDCAMNLSVLQAFTSSLPHLTDLVVVNVLPLMVTVWEAPPQLTSPRLTSLIVDVANTASPTLNNFVDWLLSTDTLNTLRSVEFGFIVLDAKVIRRALLDLGPRLQHLGLHVKSMFDSSDWEHELIQREVDIGLCANLTSLTIDLTATHSAAAFLKNVKSKDIHTLSFRIFAREGGRQPNFAALADIMANNSTMFRRVECVQFLNMADSPMSKFEAAVHRALPDLYKRGVLRVLDGSYV